MGALGIPFRLHNLDVLEVSLVEQGANQKKFLLLKHKNGGHMPKGENMEEVLKGLLESDVDESGIEKTLKDKGYSEEDAQVLKATARLLASRKDTLPKDVMKTIGEVTGFDVPKEKVVENKVEEPKAKEKVDKKTEKVEKSDPRIEAIMKEKDEINKKLEHEIGLRLTKEFVEKASDSFDQFGVAKDFGPILKECAQKLSKETYESLCTILKSVNEQMAEAKLYDERGTRGEPVGSTSEAKIQKLAEKLAQENKISVEKAYTQVINTDPQGMRLYEQHRIEKEAI